MSPGPGNCPRSTRELIGLCCAIFRSAQRVRPVILNSLPPTQRWYARSEPRLAMEPSMQTSRDAAGVAFEAVGPRPDESLQSETLVSARFMWAYAFAQYAAWLAILTPVTVT